MYSTSKYRFCKTTIPQGAGLSMVTPPSGNWILINSFANNNNVFLIWAQEKENFDENEKENKELCCQGDDRKI